MREVVRLRGNVKEWEGQGNVCRQVEKKIQSYNQSGDYQKPKKLRNCTQVLECIEKISALETEIGDASTMRLVLFLLLAPTGALTVTVIYYSI